ncbi:MAG: energy transducer TonB [Prevotella sp.]|nr:energy transducer TonB [Prevotella sp.]
MAHSTDAQIIPNVNIHINKLTIMRKIITLFALLLCTIVMQGQRTQNVQQGTKGDYEFILPQKPSLNMEYPKGVNLDEGVQTYKALSYDHIFNTAFIYNEKHCGYYDVPHELRSGFSSSVKDLQKENSTLYWKRVKEIMTSIDKYWESHKTYGSDEKVFEVVEQMPSFPGGMGALMQYLSTNIKYPKEAEQRGIQGRVICKFIVNRDGSIENVRVTRNVDPQLDAEAVRVIRNMPTWIPGKHAGEPCRVKFTLPVTFKLH